MKAVKFTLFTLITLSLLSCDVFLAPLKLRFNPDDPNRELVKADVTLNPVADGYLIGPMPGTKDFTSTSFTAGMDAYGLVRFDLSGLPAIITKAELRLYNLNAAGAAAMKACRIIQVWDPASIQYTTVIGGGFFDASNAPVIDVQMNSYNTWDVTGLVKNGVPNGFCITSSAAMSVTIASVENATNKPQLVISGFNYP
jgi:hypothetical protein